MVTSSLLIDATSATDRITGFERYTREVAARLAHKTADHGLRVTVLLAKHATWWKAGDSSSRITIRRSPWASRVLTEQIWIPLVIGTLHPSMSFFPAFPPSPLVFVMNPRGKVTRTIMDAVMWTQSKTMSWKGRVYGLMERIGVRRYDNVHTISEFSKKEIEDAVPVLRGRLQASGIAVDVERFSKLPSESSEDERILKTHGIELPKKYLLFVGTLEPRKNIPFLLRIFAQVSKQAPETKLVLVGRHGWGAEEIIATIKQLRITNSVHVLGPVSDDALPSIYAQATALLFPSLHEGFGFPIIEAMSAGLPVISSNGGALPDTVGDAGILLSPIDESAWERSILQLLDSPQLQESLRKKGLAHAVKFSWDAVVQRIFDSWQGDDCRLPLASR